MLHMPENSESAISITLRSYSSKGGTVKMHFAPTDSRNLLSAIKMMNKHLKAVFSGELFTSMEETDIAIIKQEVVSRIEMGKSTENLMPSTFTELIDKTVNNMKGIINVQEQIQGLKFRGKEEIAGVCFETLEQYQNFKNPPLEAEHSKTKVSALC